MTTEDTITTDQLADVMTSRANTYGLLSRLFLKEVNQALVDEMRAMEFPTATGNERADDGYRQLYTFLKGYWSDSLRQLAVDYMKTFIGHGVDAYSAAYPFESVHTSERRLLMQEARDEVLAIYRENDLKKNQAWSEGEDHIALELEFMQVMSLRTADALSEGAEDEAVRLLDIQYDFLEEHLLNWVPMLTNDMLKFADTDFYKGLANLTRGFIEIDQAVLLDLLSDDE